MKGSREPRWAGCGAHRGRAEGEAAPPGEQLHPELHAGQQLAQLEEVRAQAGLHRVEPISADLELRRLGLAQQRPATPPAAQLELLFSGFCAVSGSPVYPSDYKRYRLRLKHAVTGVDARGGGGARAGVARGWVVAAAARRVVVAAATWAEVEPKAAWALARESTCGGWGGGGGAGGAGGGGAER